MFEREIRKLYDHLYANASVKTPAAIGTEISKLLHTALYLETEEGAGPAFPIGADAAANTARAAFTRMNKAWALYPPMAKIDLADFDLGYACSRLAGLKVSDPRHDYLGDATEIFRSDWAKQVGGQFFTDQFVTRLAMTLLNFNPLEGDDLVDICAGTGGFLLAGLHHIRKLVPAAAVAALARAALKGQDVDAGVAAIANASLKSRLGAAAADIVSVGDSLRIGMEGLRLRLDSHLCIATNPPFGTKITVKDPALLKEFALAVAPSKADVSARAPDILFLEKNLRLLRPGKGRMAIVIPYQLLSGPQARYVREWLLCHGKIKAVVDLPTETFQPHTGTKASLVLVERRPQPLAFTDIDDSHEIFFSAPRWIGHDRRGHRMYRRNADGSTGEDILTDFPEVEAAFEKFVTTGITGDAHEGSFLINAKVVYAEPSLRLNAAFYAPMRRAPITNAPALTTLVQRIFCPGRFKRNYVDRGSDAVPFLGGANISELIPTGTKWLASDDPRLKELRVEQGWILITRSGSTGIVARVPAAWHGVAMSEHVIRIVPEASKIDPGYLLAVLRSDYGQAYLARGIFGSVIDEITPDYVGQMPVPLLQDQTRADIAQAVREAEVARDRAVAGFDQAAALLNHALEL